MYEAWTVKPRLETEVTEVPEHGSSDEKAIGSR